MESYPLIGNGKGFPKRELQLFGNLLNWLGTHGIGRSAKNGLTWGTSKNLEWPEGLTGKEFSTINLLKSQKPWEVNLFPGKWFRPQGGKWPKSIQPNLSEPPKGPERRRMENHPGKLQVHPGPQDKAQMSFGSK